MNENSVIATLLRKDEKDDMEMEERFTVRLALVDAIPVAFFSIAAASLVGKVQNFVFLLGALVCILSGAGKVFWKLVIAVFGREIKVLGTQLRFMMPAGFLLMIIGVILADRAVVSSLIRSALQFPSVAFFVMAICLMAAMIYCARKFDRHDVRGNWIEQWINTAMQGCVMLGVLFLH